MRCSTSGRFTPAAATRISTSSGPGSGTGRSTGINTSGPPASAGSIACIRSGTLIVARFHDVGRGFIDLGPAPVNDSAMDLDELLPDKPDDPLTLLTRQDL